MSPLPIRLSQPEDGRIDDRMIATMRFVLASSALAIIYFDPSEPDRLVSVTYGALVLYTCYSAAILLISLRRQPLMLSMRKWAHWVDVGWYLLLISLSSGTSSIFFFFFFFSILVASFGQGFASGLKVTIASSVLFTIIGYATSLGGPEFELNRFLLRPIYLTVIGYMMSYWGGHELKLRRRLSFSKEVTSLSNPRFGVRRTIGLTLERVRAFYDADACVLVLKDPESGKGYLRSARRNDPEAGVHSEVLATEFKKLLLQLPAGHAIICKGEDNDWWPIEAQDQARDVKVSEHKSDLQELCGKLKAFLDARSLASVPLRYRGSIVGRIFLTSRRKRAFDRSDTAFLIHISEQVIPVIENIRLVDRLASDAANQERQRIARDLHDSIIQPYIGLQIGLTAIQKKLDDGKLDPRGDIAHLLDMTNDTIDDLRGYVRGLKETGEKKASLPLSLRQFASRFSDATGIAVNIESESDIRINDRLAAEVFQMIAEALSNIRRHTGATKATVKLACYDSHLTLEVENEWMNEIPPVGFTPYSITGRAESLGGHAHVESRDGATTIIVEIPL